MRRHRISDIPPGEGGPSGCKGPRARAYIYLICRRTSEGIGLTRMGHSLSAPPSADWLMCLLQTGLMAGTTAYLWLYFCPLFITYQSDAVQLTKFIHHQLFLGLMEEAIVCSTVYL